MATENDELSGFMWAQQPDNPLSMVRNLNNTERMFVFLNRDMYSQNCPYIGASISIQNTESPSGQSLVFDLTELEKRAVEAFCQTRWRYPTIAARVIEDSKAIYHIEEEDQVLQWAKRSVTVVVADGGWIAKREQVSRDLPLPSPDGDYTVIYLIVKPEESTRGIITTFDVLMHTHHVYKFWTMLDLFLLESLKDDECLPSFFLAIREQLTWRSFVQVFTDGSGIRSILNEWISRLANPLPSDEIHWGKEVDKLLPPSNVLVEPDQRLPAATQSNAQSNTSPNLFNAPDVGLPLYRPDIGPASPQNRGTKLVSYTFEPEFLRSLLATCRKHGVKLTAILHAALFQAVHETTDTVPGPEDFFKSRSAMDLRNGWMPPPHNEKRYYVNSAFAIHPIEVPCNIFGQRDDLWEAATYIANLWKVAKNQKGVVAAMEAGTAAFIESRSKQNSATPPGKPKTCPYFVSDPPGSHLLDTIFPVSGYENLQFVLESYQLATDQSQAIVSARSHSFHDRLTLCLVFNAARNPKDKMQEFLETWKGTYAIEDAGAAYKDIRYTFDEWPEYKRTGPIAEMNPTGNIPIIEMPNRKILTQSYAILRHWSRQMGGYDGKTEDEKYWVDAICDIVVDWRTLFISAFFSDNQKVDYPKHQQGDRARYLKAIETHLKGSDISRRGPFVAGKEITYADLVFFQLLHDENLIQDGRKGLEEYPRLVQLVDAVQSRPNIRKFFDSDAYLG
ncbi:hypothetical protein IFR05_005913 [Cadophora sp. M221]|nr:hypothetical protein IFR05_005913 [Cadophora sp. M221]